MLESRRRYSGVIFFARSSRATVAERCSIYAIISYELGARGKVKIVSSFIFFCVLEIELCHSRFSEGVENVM
jgi:hypothetical protein